MKSTILRPATLLALALSLAGCGSKNTFDVNVNFINPARQPTPVAYDGLVLTNGSRTLSVPANTTKTKFAEQIEYGDTYNVVIASDAHQPQHQTCTVDSGSDTAGRLASIDVYVTCTINVNNVAVTVKGLGANQSVGLTNGTSGVLTATGTATGADVTINFPVTYGNAYGITVIRQPDGRSCAVANGVGVMGDVPITNVVVNCTPT